MNRTIKIFLLASIFLFLKPTVPLIRAQSNDDCMMCHDDPTLITIVNGKTSSVFVDIDTFSNSIHGDFDCIECHSDLEDIDSGHDKDVSPVLCNDCHEDVDDELINGPHGQWPEKPGIPSAACITCHGTHDILEPDDTKSPTNPRNVNALCNDCHQGQNDIYNHSIHAVLKDDRPNAACTDCHKGHSMARPETEELELKVCGKCHRKEVEQQARSEETRLNSSHTDIARMPSSA